MYLEFLKRQTLPVIFHVRHKSSSLTFIDKAIPGKLRPVRARLQIVSNFQ